MKKSIADQGKIRGGKVFACDMRPADMEGWPQTCKRVLLLRATVADRPFIGISADSLSAQARPAKIITAADLVGDQNKLPDNEFLFVRPKRIPDFIGQPVALAYFDDYLSHFAGATELRASVGCQKYGPVQAEAKHWTISDQLIGWRQQQVLGKYYGQAHYQKKLDPMGQVIFPLIEQQHFAKKYNPFPGAEKSELNTLSGNLYRELSSALSNPGIDYLSLEHSAATQMVDPMFLEPESGLAWLNRNDGVLHLVLGTQSAAGDASAVKSMFKSDSAVKDVRITACLLGGGFGGRDKSGFAQYLALAAYYADGPVRLAFDRYEQFQGGLKRHASASHLRIGVDASGKFMGLLAHLVFAGGGQKNLTTSVNSLGTLHASGPYNFSFSSLHGMATTTGGPIAGSMRGFGIPQACFNIEVLVDRVAQLRREDAIALRQRNLLRMTDVDAGGAPLQFHLATHEICDLAAKHPMWTNREDEKAKRSVGSIRYGVGFACCMEAYGTSTDGVHSAIALDAQGGITVFTEVTDMGQGSHTALRSSTLAALGAVADRVKMSEYKMFTQLGLTTDRQKAMEKSGTDNPDDYPRFSLAPGSGTSASRTAFFHVHALREAINALWITTLLPAAAVLWELPEKSLQGFEPVWTDGLLQRQGCRPLALRELAQVAIQKKWALGAMVHCCFYNGWSAASFPLHSADRRLYADALALYFDNGDPAADPYAPASKKWEPIERIKGSVLRPSQAEVKFYRTLYASGAHLIGVEVDADSGAVRVTDAVSIIDAGDPIHLDLLMGQIEGGLAMGISHALYEHLPDDVGRPRAVNLDKYRIARAADLPRDSHHERVLLKMRPEGILGKDQPMARSKGVAEVTMTTVAPAIANAVAHALDHAFWPNTLPIRKADVRERRGAKNV